MTDAPHAPVSGDPDDRRVAGRLLRDGPPWLDPGKPVPYGHLLASAALLRCAPAAVVSRLAALGYHEVERPGGPLPEAVAPEDTVLLRPLGKEYDFDWLDVTAPVPLRQTVVLAEQLGVAPAEVARRLTALGYHYPAVAGPLPETHDARDVLLIRTDAKGNGEWLDHGEQARARHVLDIATRLKCGPHAAALRLVALGVRLPYTPHPDDDRLLGLTGRPGDGLDFAMAAQSPGHVLDAARATGRRPADVVARLAELGCWGTGEVLVPDVPEPDDLVVLSERLDGRAPWLRVNGVVGVALRHVLRAALVTGRGPAATAERLAALGHRLHKNAIPPAVADEEDIRLLGTVDRSFLDGVHLEHVLRSASLTCRSPADVAARLTALGYRLPDEVVYPETRAVPRG